MNEPKKVSARFPIVCTACGRLIRSGAFFWRWKTPDGEERMHPECYTARAEGLKKKVAS